MYVCVSYIRGHFSYATSHGLSAVACSRFRLTVSDLARGISHGYLKRTRITLSLHARVSYTHINRDRALTKLLVLSLKKKKKKKRSGKEPRFAVYTVRYTEADRAFDGAIIAVVSRSA